MIKSAVYRIPNILQNYTKTDISYLVKGGFWLNLSYIIQIGVGILTTVLLANFLEKEELGTYQYIMSMAGVLSVFTLSGLGTAVTRAVAKGDEGILRKSVYLKLQWSITIFLVSGCISLYYYFNDNQLLSASFLIIGSFAPFIESFKLYENFLHGKQAFKESVTLGLWRKPIPLLSLFATLLFTTNILFLVLVYFVSNSLSYFLVYLVTAKKYQSGIGTGTGLNIRSIAKHQSVFRIINTIAAQFDKIILWSTLGSVVVASFSISQLAVKYSGVFISSVSTLTLPKASKRDLAVLQQTLPRKIIMFTLVMAVYTAVYVLIAPFIFGILFPKYPESVAISQLLAVSFLFLPRTVLNQVLIAHDQNQYQYILNISMAGTKIALLAILIPMYGIWGAVYSILISEFLNLCLTYYFFKRAKSS